MTSLEPSTAAAPEGPSPAVPASWLALTGAGGGLLGLLLALGWHQGWPAVSALAVLAGATALVLLVLRARARQRRATASQQAERERLHLLERRARQLDEAEHLVSVGSFDWSPTSGELHWSEQHYRQWGYEPGAVEPSLEVFVAGLHPDDAERVQEALNRALRGELRYDCRHRVLRADGSVLHVHARGEVFFDDQGRAERMIGAVLDVTERVEAEAGLRLQGFVLDALPDAVSAVDVQTQRYRLVNRAWLEINRLDREQALGSTVDEVYPSPVGRLRADALADCLAKGRGTTVRGPGVAAGRQGSIVETRMLPFTDPHLAWSGAVMISRDVSDDEAVHERLEASIDHLRLTLNTIGDAIFATDAEGPDEPVLFANEQLLKTWSIPPQRAKSLCAREIIEFARPFFVDPDAEVARIGAIIGGQGDAEDRLELNDRRVLLRRCQRVQLTGRQVRVWTFRDITLEAHAVRRLAAAESRQRSLLGAFPGFIWVIDAAHRVVFLNPAAMQAYAPRVPPQLPCAAHEVFGDDILAQLTPALERTLAGESVTFEWRRRCAEAPAPEVLLVRTAFGTDADGGPLAYGFGVDISALKEAEAALGAAKDEAERASRAKTQFLSSMSHELRTPLNAVIGFSQVLELNSEGNLGERQLRHLADIRRAGQHLLSLINDLLDLTRIEAGRTTLTLQPVALLALAEECLQLVRATAPAGMPVVLEPSPPQAVVQADRVRLQQVLVNLLANAVKFNRAGGQVSLAWQRDAGGGWRLEVRDQGPGLDAQAQQRLFVPFERLDADRRGVAGTGIGLALSRSLVVLMGARIGVDSTPGQGSCFWVSLGAAADLPLAAATPSAHPALLPPAVPRLLYVDDNPVNLALMEGLFEDLPDWQLQTCGDPVAALGRVRREAFDLLLVDLQMPGLDGWQLYEQVRADAATRSLPMIAVSADLSPATVQRCRQMGFADFVPKPVDAARLLDSAARALGRGPASTATPSS